MSTNHINVNIYKLKKYDLEVIDYILEYLSESSYQIVGTNFDKTQIKAPNLNNFQKSEDGIYNF